MSIDMKDYGYDGAETGSFAVCRVILQEKNLYRVVCATGEKRGEISGKLRFEAEISGCYPAVGDFVTADVYGDTAVINAILPRKSVFIRKAAGKTTDGQVVAANIDKVFICMSLNNDFNIRRLERYLSIAYESGATPVILLTKADLCDDVDARRSEVEDIAVGADVVVTSSLTEDGYEAVKPYITPGVTIAFIGSSGVGKSTLINRLCGTDTLATNGLRNDDKGRHTTTHRELILLPNGGMVIDTPGMRELGMWNASEGVGRSFAEIDALAAKCRYSDCRHGSEPGCAVKAALESGELDRERYESYLKLKNEAAFNEDRSAYMSKKAVLFRNIAKANKNNKKR